MADDEVGSLGQETLKLLRALAVDADTTAPRRNDADAGSPDADAHVCTTSWCPVCQVVGFVKTNPDVVEEVAVAALHLARTVRDAFETALRQGDGTHDTSDRRTDEGEASR
ncbi:MULTISPECIES: hypothetical protein [unclassified Aeromicrobium]|uniref:hypothetical protein n=1 Tax=unclassified Aeromicrobium TaxID=2633570 RepID=UPI0012E0E27A|nr:MULTISPECIES: hypothetical protein [unclassified Aeromicrobium]